MSFSRILRSGLVLASIFALAGAAAGGGCAQANVPGSTSTGGKITGSSGASTGSGGSDSHCTGTPPACTGLDDFDCKTTNGCTHLGQCQGTALDCGSLSASGCVKQPGCKAATTGNCFGSAQSCFNYSNQSSCSQQQGCIWNQNQFFCSGTPSTCQQLNNQACLTQQGCMLNQSSDCQGTPLACPMLTDADGCNKEIGCTWVSECSGTPNPCATLSDADCPYQPGCTCDGCGSTSSSSSGGGPMCMKQSDCDPAMDPCRTGNCINGACVKIPNCQPCVKQIQCNPHTTPCFTGNCIDGMCQALPSCQGCTTQADCPTGNSKCFTGACTDGNCVLQTMCINSDGCCPLGCAGTDNDCP